MLALTRTLRAEEATALRIAYLHDTSRLLTISPRETPARDNGWAGAQLALDDSNTTGGFTGQHFDLINLPTAPDDALADRLAMLHDASPDFVLADLPAEGLIALASALPDLTLLNISAPDESLRGADCRTNLLHIAPSRTMLADALAQYLVWKRWTRWLLVVGSHPEDEALAAAYRRAAKRFGAKIVAERVSPDTGGARQTDSGLTQTQSQMPLLTQGAADHDVVIAADENEIFAGYLPYRTWDARPVAGSAGLRPVSWDANAQSWGGEQLQSRFTRRFHRDMSALDMQAWTAMRLITEAAIAAKSVQARDVNAMMRSPDFGIGAYKGVKLSIRPWNSQLRQPIFLADGRTTVSISPQPGFLHQTNDLDTLGIDRPETTCHLP